MFPCLPNQSKCEWRNLAGFVTNYNRTYSTNYTIAECLDIHPSNRKYPEFRLRSVGLKDIVIEHKIIPWPPDHVRYHRAQHDFFETVAEKLHSEFSDALYILEANSTDLVLGKRNIAKLVGDICQNIISNRNRIKSEGNISGINPIPWHFRQIHDFERDDDMPEKGIGIHLNVPDNSFDFSPEDEKEMNEGIKRKFLEHLDNTAKKFIGFEECIKIFITELFSDNYLLSHELIENISKEVLVPVIIDQIWVGFPVWINDSEFTTEYKRIDSYKNK